MTKRPDALDDIMAGRDALMTPKEVAALLRVTPWTVRRLFRHVLIRRGVTRYVIRRSDVERHMRGLNA